MDSTQITGPNSERDATSLPPAAPFPGSRDLIGGTPAAPRDGRPENGHPLAGVDVMLAPLCGITDSVFRKVCLDHGADMAVTEMISSEGLVRNSHHVRAVRDLDMSNGPLSLQIFGSDPETMGEAAAILSELEPHYLDMNFGCPVRKIVSKNGGSAMLRDVKHLNRVCRRVVERSRVPVSAKIRSGWDKPSAESLRDIGRAIEDAGVSMVAIHARTRKQAFKGKANWLLIKTMKEAVSIPVVGNGDVTGPESYFELKAQTGCDAVMVGRGAIGNPWIFGEIKAAIEQRDYRPPTHRERVQGLLAHVKLSVQRLGEPTGLIVLRKIMAAYLKRLPNARGLRGQLMTCERIEALEALLDTYLRELDESDTPAATQTPEEATLPSAC
ncbi:MAG: tRNA dihydrouridine synthase DusB [Candidatus Krumholzibacteria bacterium]